MLILYNQIKKLILLTYTYNQIITKSKKLLIGSTMPLTFFIKFHMWLLIDGRKFPRVMNSLKSMYFNCSTISDTFQLFNNFWNNGLFSVVNVAFFWDHYFNGSLKKQFCFGKLLLQSFGNLRCTPNQKQDCLNKQQHFWIAYQKAYKEIGRSYKKQNASKIAVTLLTKLFRISLWKRGILCSCQVES